MDKTILNSIAVLPFSSNTYIGGAADFMFRVPILPMLPKNHLVLVYVRSVNRLTIASSDIV